MSDKFPGLQKLKYEKDRNPLTFKFYDAEQVIIGKTAKEHMDAFVPVLINAAAFIEGGLIDAFIKERYSILKNGFGGRIVSGDSTLAELTCYAEESGISGLSGSGKQESPESIRNSVMFGL